MPVIPVDPLSVTPDWLSEVLGAEVSGCRLEQIAVGVELLGRLCRAHLDGGNGFTFGILHGLESVRAEQAERELPAAWKKLSKPKNTRWLRS